MDNDNSRLVLENDSSGPVTDEDDFVELDDEAPEPDHTMPKDGTLLKPSVFEVQVPFECLVSFFFL